MQTHCLAALALVGLVSVSNASPQQDDAPFLGVYVNQAGGTLVLDDTVPGSPAAGAGLQRGDQLLAVGDSELSDQPSLQQALSSKAVGDSIRLTIARTLRVELGSSPSNPTGAWLGVSIDESNGVRVSSIEDGSPAATGGLAAGDRIVSFGESSIESFDDLRQALASASAGDEVQVTVRRVLELRLGSRPAEEAPSTGRFEVQTEEPRPPQAQEPREPRQPRAPRAPREPRESRQPSEPPQPPAPRSGFFLGSGESTQPGGAAFLGVSLEEGDDVVITDIVPGSAAERGGLQAGFVLRSIDGQAVASAEDVADAVRRKRAGDSISIVIGSPDGDLERSLGIVLGERPGADEEEGDGWQSLDTELGNLKSQRLAELESQMRARQEVFAKEMAAMQAERGQLARELGVQPAPLRMRSGESTGDVRELERAVERARADAARARVDAERATQQARSEAARANELRERSRGPQPDSGLDEQIRRLREDVAALRKEIAALRQDRR